MSQLPAAVIFNSGFEAPIVASPYNYLTGSQLDGWNIVGRVLHFDSSYRPVGGDRYSIQFDESTIGISQSFPTTVGGLYFVNFDLSAWDFVGSSGRSGGVRAGLIESYSLFESTGSMAFSEEFIGYSDAYVEQTYYFTATSATTTLGFTSSRLYPHLDNVEVFPIPEPSASLIFVVSAISTLAFRRRLRPSSHAPE